MNPYFLQPERRRQLHLRGRPDPRGPRRLRPAPHGPARQGAEERGRAQAGRRREGHQLRVHWGGQGCPLGELEHGAKEKKG